MHRFLDEQISLRVAILSNNFRIFVRYSLPEFSIQRGDERAHVSLTIAKRKLSKKRVRGRGKKGPPRFNTRAFIDKKHERASCIRTY